MSVMARKRTTTPIPDSAEHVIDIDVSEEMKESFLEYAYSIIYSRALPDARDGLKPVQRRILFQMDQMGLAPDRGHVKSSRVVGDVMGRLHPHGDAAIYDAMVRLAQPFSLRLPLVDGHGNFGSLDDGPAAPRYTEVRMATPATAMTADLDEGVVDMVANYDNTYREPEVLPAAIPNLLVNGASGIAVGMATNMPPHNLGEVVAGARYLLGHPEATLDDIMRFIPGPDFPDGGKIVGLDGIRDAYESGRGTFRTRATARIENITARKKGIVVTELPYLVGPERVIEKIKAGVQSKKLQGITSIQDLTDRNHGLRLVIEVKNTVNPEALLERLYRLTPMEESFGINNVALVAGQPQTLGLLGLLQVFLDHRMTVIRRRSEFRLGKARDRLHLVEGLLIAILDIDEVIAVIRSSDDVATARTRLMTAFDLTEIQANHILELRLRRLTKFSRIELEGERDALLARIAELEEILGSVQRQRDVVSQELADVAAKFATPRRTILLESAGAPAAAAAAMPVARGADSLDIADDPCFVLLSGTGLLARTAEEPSRSGPRQSHDALTSVVPATVRGQVGVVTTAGRIIRLDVVDAPGLPASGGAPSLAGGVPLRELVTLERTEEALALVSLADDAPPIALATAAGRVKRLSGAHPSKDSWDIVSLADSDTVVWAGHAADTDVLVLIASDGQLLRFGADSVRPQGRAGQGIAGMRLGGTAAVMTAGAIPAESLSQSYVVTVAGSSDGLPGTQPGSVKVTPLDRYPAKGRATGGVRAHRFLRGEDSLQRAWVGDDQPRAVGGGGQPLDLPEVDERRDASGSAMSTVIAAIG